VKTLLFVASFLLLSGTAFGGGRRFGLDEPEYLFAQAAADSLPSREQGWIVLGDSMNAPSDVGRVETKHPRPLPFQLAGAVGGGVAGAYLLGGAVAILVQDDDSADWEELGAIMLGVVVGYPLGAAAGAHLAGGEGGSFHHALAGVAAGVLAGALLAEPTDGWSFIVGVPLGAVWGWNEFGD
jgi:hypothetical protein